MATNASEFLKGIMGLKFYPPNARDQLSNIRRAMNREKIYCALVAKGHDEDDIDAWEDLLESYEELFESTMEKAEVDAVFAAFESLTARTKRKVPQQAEGAFLGVQYHGPPPIDTTRRSLMQAPSDHSTNDPRADEAFMQSKFAKLSVLGTSNAHARTWSISSTAVSPGEEGTRTELARPTHNLNPSAQPFNPSTTITQAAAAPRFRPSRALTGGAPLFDFQKVQAAGLDVSKVSAYAGEVNAAYIADATTPDHLNCALHITGIHPQASLHEILSTVKGKISIFSLKSPIPGVHFTCAARLVFQEREIAERYVRRSFTDPGISIRGKKVKVTWNRDKAAPASEEELTKSRVLQVRGPKDRFSGAELIAFLKNYIAFDLVEGGEWFEDENQKTVQFVFCSIRGQSRVALECLRKEYIAGTWRKGLFKVRFGPDPCE